MRGTNLRFPTLLIIATAFLAPKAPAATITFNDLTLGNGSFSWSASGFTLSAAASAGGTLSSIPSGQFAGLWFGTSVSSNGVYTLSFSQPVSSVEFQFDAASGIYLPTESLGSFTISSGPATLNYVNLQYTSFDGATVTMTSGLDDGQGIMTVTGSPFTYLSFVHAQNPDNNGSVIERVTVTTVPEPASCTLCVLAGSLLLALRRRH